jgi:malonyl-CoA/methylmalonyl-CoA synthetase
VNLIAWQRHTGTPVEADALVHAITEGSLVQAFSTTAMSNADRPALSLPGTTEATGEWISHGELDARAARTAGWLADQGLRPGERVVLCGRNSLALVVGYLSVLRAGGVVVLASPAYTKNELAHLVSDSGAERAFCGAETRDALTDLVDIVVDLDGPLPHGKPITPTAVASDTPALLAYTSGTTGVPKGVPLTHANLLASIRAAMLAWRWRADDVLVHALPLSHQHGLGGVHATLLAGSRAVILPGFEAAALAQAAVTHEASVLFAVPTMYGRIVADPTAAAALRELRPRLTVCGSAPLTPELAERVHTALGEIPLERYGSTEAGLAVSNPIEGPRLPGDVGLPLPGLELRIAGPGGEPAPDGEDGEVLLRGPQVFGGYWNRPEATAEAFYPGGWFRTGDVGRIDPGTGYLRITGRLKELIISGGLNVYPSEVERALEKHPSVEQAAVAGLPSDTWGEQVTAWVVLNAGADLDEETLIAHCRGLLAAYKCPKQVFAVAALPRNTMGKIIRRDLVPPARRHEDETLDTSSLDRAVERLYRADLP